MSSEPSSPKVLLWDIECTNLNADWGYILCIGWKWLGSDEVTVRSLLDFPDNWDKDRTDDSALVRDFSQVFNQAEYQVTWYGKRFDYPYLQSRLIQHELHPVTDIPHIDGWHVARYKMKLSSNRLANLERFLGLPEWKTPVGGKLWQKAAAGYMDAFDNVINHCERDVFCLEDVWTRIRPLTAVGVNMNLHLGTRHHCPKCGADALQARGIVRTKLSHWQRYQCQDCGGWSKKPVSYEEMGIEHKSTEIVR